MPVTSLDCVKFTVGLLHDQNRFQWTGGYASDSTPQPNTDVDGDFAAQLTGAIYTAFKDCFCADVQILGYQIEPLLRDTPTLPTRTNYPLGTYEGEAAGDSTPSQTSMLAVYYSDEQMQAEETTRTGKLFLGPAPEDVLDSGVIPPGAFNANINELVEALKSFVGSVTGYTWTRLLGPVTALGSPPPGQADFYKVDYHSHRRELFTQRRRMRPLL